jgi:hypothetical protein
VESRSRQNFMTTRTSYEPTPLRAEEFARLNEAAG